MTCSCGATMRWTQPDAAVAQCQHADRHGIVWLRNNEVWVRKAHWQRGTRAKHIGTFPTFAEAQNALERALSRAQH